MNILNKQYQFEFLKLTTAYIEQMTDTTYGIMISLLREKLQGWNGQPQLQTDLLNYLIIVSNLLEYEQYDII